MRPFRIFRNVGETEKSSKELKEQENEASGVDAGVFYGASIDVNNENSRPSARQV